MRTILAFVVVAVSVAVVVVAFGVPLVGAIASGPPVDEMMIVSPASGVFFASDSPGGPPIVQPGDWVTTDMLIGRVGSMEVRAPYDGQIMDVMVSEGDKVDAGQALFVLGVRR